MKNNFITVTFIDGERCLLNVNNIIFVYAEKTSGDEVQTRIDLVDGDYIIVSESVEEIDRMLQPTKVFEATVTEESKLYNGRVMCIESKDLIFTVGKIYPCINGRLIDDDKDIHDPYCFGLESFEELSMTVTDVKFIEVKGEVKIDD